MGTKAKATIVVTLDKACKRQSYLDSSRKLHYTPSSFDSDFGKATKFDLYKFQKANKITADKKPGKATFNELFDV
ncbi:peptidoglycan-binding protein [Peribacillus simplex]